MRKIILAVIFLLAAERPQIAEDHAGQTALLRQPISLSKRADFSYAYSSVGPKLCSQVYPVPQHAQKWTKCQEKDVSECGGPSDCACNVDERLLTYTCAEGTYRSCEEDNSCRPDSPSL